MDIVKNKLTIVNLLQKVKRDGIEQLIKYLSDIHYFTIELDLGENGSFPHIKGSLAQHSLDTYNTLCILDDIFKVGLNKESMIIVGLLHDICRCDQENKFPVGHSEKSIFMIQRYITLTDEQIIAINSHMGGCDNRFQDYNIIEKSWDEYPLALFLYNADIISATYIERYA